MFQTLVVLLLVLWFVGMVTSNTMGGMIHIALALAIAIVVVRLIRGRRVLG